MILLSGYILMKLGSLGILSTKHIAPPISLVSARRQVCPHPALNLTHCCSISSQLAEGNPLLRLQSLDFKVGIPHGVVVGVLD